MTTLIETTGDLCNFVLRSSGLNGVGQTPLADDSNTCLTFLQMLIGQWQRKRYLVWNEQEMALISTGGSYYTIGAGGDFDTARPDKIHAAFARLGPGFGNEGGAELAAMMPFPLGAQPIAATSNLVDLPLQIIEAKEDWAQITIKDLKSMPAAVFYDSSFPIGRVYFWPVPPASQYELHLVVKGSLPSYATLVDPLNLPDEYIEALVWSLCVRMQMAYGLPSRPDHVAAMRVAMETVRLANSQIALLGMPAALSGHRGSDKSSWAGAGLNQAWTIGGPSTLG